MTNEAQKLRALAAWYREFAERDGANWIWEGRLRRADELEKKADHLQALAEAGPPAAHPRHGQK